MQRLEYKSEPEKTLDKIRELHNADHYDELAKSLVELSISNPSLYQLAVQLQDENDWCVFESLLRHQPPEICLTLIDNLSDAAFDQIMRLRNNKHSCIMLTAIVFQSPDVCLKIMSRLSRKMLDGILTLQTKDSRGLLEYAIKFQTDGVFIALIKKTSRTALTQAVTQFFRPRHSFIELASLLKGASAFQFFLQRFWHAESRFVINNMLKNVPELRFPCFKSIALHQPIESCDQFLSFLDEESREKLLDDIKHNAQYRTTRYALRALQYKHDRRHPHVSEHSLPGQLMSVSDEKPERAWLHQLMLTWRSYSKRIEERDKHPASGHAQEKNALNLFSAGAFVKIIRADKSINYDDFVAHLFHPMQRHVIRNMEGKTKQGYKLLLNPQPIDKKQNEKKAQSAPVLYSSPTCFFPIIKARSEFERVIHKWHKNPYTTTTKYAVTYVSKNRFTPLFGYHAEREVVGFAFTVNQDNIKLLSTQDCSTYGRWWYSEDFNSLMSQAHRAEQFICRSFAEFVRRVDNQPYVMNEALVKLGTNDLFAIVIGGDTVSARKIATERRLELMADYHRDLPILFYNPEKQQASIYTSVEQQNDNPELFLAAIAEMIEQQYTPLKGVKGFFNRASKAATIHLHFDYQDYLINETIAKRILNQIQKNIKTPSTAILTIKNILGSPGEAQRSLGAAPKKAG